MTNITNNGEQVCRKVESICRAYVDVARAKLGEKCPMELLVLYWVLVDAIVGRFGFAMASLKDNELSMFRARFPALFINWYFSGYESVTPEMVQQGVSVFEKCREEGQVIVELAQTNDGVMNGLRVWEKQRVWGQQMMKDPLVGAITVATLVGVFGETIQVLNAERE